MSEGKIVDALLAEKRITQKDADKINRYMNTSSDGIEAAIVKQGILSRDEFIQFLSKYFRAPVIDLAAVKLTDSIVQLIPYNFAIKSACIPIKRVGKMLGVAVADPSDLALMDEIKFITNYEVEPYVTSKEDIIKAINQHYKGGDMTDVIADLQEELKIVEEEEEETDIKKLQASIEETPVVRYVDSIIVNAVRKGASDIHIEPYEKLVRVRTRLDGVLTEETNPPLKLKSAIISRIKVMATLDLAEHRVPQDGRIKMKLQNKAVDLRVSTLPTLYGEKVVMRVLDKSALCVDLEKLGFESQDLEKFSKAIQAPYGLLLVTGPTGSGKTTTLYSALSRINTPDTNIMTVEDPVEYNFMGINQVQANEKVGLTFASALRSFLRQDPDKIMVGEIRDTETASIAIRAALTGHLVLSTLHTNDAPSAISRLIDMDIEPFLVSSSLLIVLAQRLVRKICPKCKEPTKVSPDLLAQIGLTEADIQDITPYRGKGCSECNQGYKGREGIYEVMVVSDKIKTLTIARRPTNEIEEVAIQEGMSTLRTAAISKFKKGVITLEEVIRVTASI